MESIYKNATEAAKGIRAELKASFPGIKFSVRTRYFSMGDSIDISWKFGPTDAAVSAITSKYQEGRFDGMTDSSWHEDTLMSMPDGEVKILGGAKFVHTSRNLKTDKDDYSSETAFLERVGRDICAIQGVEYKGPNTNIYGHEGWNPHDSAQQVAYRVLNQTDLTNGYNGLRFNPEAGSRSTREFFQVIPMGEVAAPAAPAHAEEIAPVVLEVHIAAALEIITHIGTPIRTMRTEARRAAIAHRCYIRYPAMDRELVMRAVLTILVCEMTNSEV